MQPQTPFYKSCIKLTYFVSILRILVKHDLLCGGSLQQLSLIFYSFKYHYKIVEITINQTTCVMHLQLKINNIVVTFTVTIASVINKKTNLYIMRQHIITAVLKPSHYALQEKTLVSTKTITLNSLFSTVLLNRAIKDIIIILLIGYST